ncbi:MAG: hypothetical protein QM758_08140 [Armatimonas sp.]
MQTPKSPPAGADKFAPELQKLTTRFNEGRQAVFTAYQKAPEANQMKVYTDGMARLNRELGPQFLALANKARGTVTGLRARMQHLNMAEDAKPQVILQLAQDVVRIEGKNPDMARAITQLGFLRYQLRQPAEQQKLITLLLDAERITPYPGVKAQAMYQRGQLLYDARKKPEALALMKQTVGKYPTTTAAADAKRTIFELENLQIGMVAPEMTGKDETDTPFKLTDYRGKVVVLDFWGFW